jgi:uncharacterized protein (TIGR03083 family)
MANKSIPLVELIKSESERLKEYVNSLSPEALDRPSPCERWNVGEVVAHLIWFVETYGGMMERGLRGDQSPPEGFPAVPGTRRTQAVVDEFYGQAAIDLRRSLGQKLLPTFNERYDWLNDMLKGIGPEDWDKPCYHAAGIRSVESFIPTIFAELALHEWDIRSTLEPSPPVSEKSIPVLMEKIPGNRGRPWSISFPDMPNALGPIRYRFELTGIGAKKLDVVVEASSTRLEPAVEAAASVSVICDTSAFVLLMYGRLTLGSAMAADRLVAEGDPDLISAFDRWLEGS